MNISRTFRRPSAGFTLVELVISSALMAIILTGAYLCLNACLSSQKLAEPRLEALQNARVAMSIMSADLRGACPLSKDYDLLGTQRWLGEMEADSVDFATHHYTPRRPREGDFCAVSFFVERDAQTGQLCLWRRRNPTIAFDPLSGGSREEIARGVRGLRFEYYDGINWEDEWGELNPRKEQYSQRSRSNRSGLPEAVRITLWLDPNPRAKSPLADESTNSEPPLLFQTVARLNLAGSSQRGALGDSSTKNGPDSGSPATQGAPNPGN